MNSHYYVEASVDGEEVTLRQVAVRNGKRVDEAQTMSLEEARSWVIQSKEWISNLQQTVEAVEGALGE